MMDEVFDQLETLMKTERRVAMATLVATRGTSPKKEGAKMWVGERGRILGSVTIGGCVDARVIEAAEEALASLKPQLLSIDMGEEDATEAEGRIADGEAEQCFAGLVDPAIAAPDGEQAEGHHHAGCDDGRGEEAHDEVAPWLDSWGTEDELPPPKCG